MQLRRLELVGFKTFVARTELEFHPGITAIVGPNGSGKSNIFDGIRWALGEMNPRLLRGARMDDVIFSGSAGRRAHSLATVALTLDNGAGGLPLDFNEITVSRTVTRGGEGQYALNGVDCRLRDIQMLFLGTGLGGRSYALIGQGEVDAVLRASPIERRQWLEEAAGLARHKRQRVEAERRLGHAQAHLERLTDLVGELESQQQALAAQAEAAVRHQAYTREVTDLEVALFADEARRLLGGVKRLGDQLARDREGLAAADRQVADTSHAVEAGEARLAEATDAWERLQRDLLDGAERLSAHAADVQALDARLQGLRVQREGVAVEDERVATALDRMRAEADAMRANAAAAQRDREERARAVDEAGTTVEMASRELAEADARLAAARGERDEVERTRAQTMRDLAALRARADVLRQSIEGAAQKAAAMVQAVSRLAHEQRAAHQAQSEARRTVEVAEAAAGQCARTAEAARQALAALEKQAGAIDLDEHRLRAQLGPLEEAHEQFAGLDEGVRAVLEAARQDRQRFPGLRGAVTDLIEVPAEYRSAITAALGRCLHGIVVDRRTDIDGVRAFVQQEGAGAAAVLALEALRPRPIVANGYHAVRALEVVGVSDGLRPLVETLLGEVAIVEDLPAAWRLFADGFPGRVVTLDGAALAPDGVVYLRGRAASDGSPLGRRQAIAEMRQSLGAVEARRSEIEAQRRDAAQRGAISEEALAGARAAYERAAASAAVADREYERLDAEKTRLTESQRVLAAEDGPRVDALGRLERDIERVQIATRDLESEAQRLDGHMKDMQADLDRAGGTRAAAAAALASHRLALVQLDERVEAMRPRLADREAAISELEQRRTDLGRDAERLAQDYADSVEQRSRAASACEELQARQAGGKAEIERLNAERSRLREEMAAHHTGHQTAQESRREAEAAVHRTEVRAAQAEAELGAAAGRLEQEFGVTLEIAADRRLPGSRDEVQRRLEGARAALLDLGAVNLRAIDEHTAVTARVDVLRAQADDIRQAADALRQAITHINAALRAGFRKTFEDVDREFGRLFQRLFEGGEGHLELVEGDPGAEPGLEVIAQLPGKARRPLVALSGGERVLVALSLIFAMLRVHPSPFCIFDEVEAALDDANTKRFTTLLRDLAEQTQVLIITHNKGTMAASDVLYGVTMQEPGISSLVSLRLVQASGSERERETVALPAE